MSRKRVDLKLENVTIEAVAAEGKALAHVDGMVVFVDFAVPGDIVDIQVFKKKKNYMEGFISRMVKPSPHRLEAFCEHFGVCGGCRWQPLPYEMQLEAKRQQVCDQLVRIGHLEVPEIRPTLPSEHIQFYRNKLEFSASCRRWVLQGEDPDAIPDNDRMGLGFHVGKFFDKVLDIKKCWLQPEPSNAIRLFIKEFCIKNSYEFYNIRENHGFFRNMFIRTTESGAVMLIVCFAHEDVEKRTALLDAVAAEFPAITSLYYVINEKLNDSISDQSPVLYKGDDFAALTGNEVVYDLYTGTGTIAQFVSRKASKVIGIEYVPEAIEDAKVNASANGIDNCQFFAGDMKDVLNGAFIAKHGRPDVIILDPPRAGIHPDVAKVILDAAPDRMVYVSCNPASQARDLAILCEDYEITAVQPVDMFPHTMHVENVCALKRKVK